MKRILSVGAALLLLGAGAETKTWNGGPSGEYKVAENWSPSGIPADTDEVVISGDVTVVWKNGSGDWAPDGTVKIVNGATLQQEEGYGSWPNWKENAHLILDKGTYDANAAGKVRINAGKVTIRNGGVIILKELSRKEGSILDVENGKIIVNGNYTAASAGTYKDSFKDAELIVSGEFQPKNGAEFENLNMTCKLASMTGICSLLSGSITFSGDQKGGLYNEGTKSLYFNFPQGSTCRVTMAGSADTIYSQTFGTSATPKFRYNGEVIDSVKFATLFNVEEADGKVSFWPVPVSEKAPELSTASVVLGNADDSAVVNVSFAKVGDPAAEVYLVYGVEDKGHKLEAWGENKISLGTATGAGLVDVPATGLPKRQFLKLRVIAVNEEGTSASDLFTFYTHYYGVEGVVNEWLGKVSTSLTEADNWSLGHVPTNDEIRWFETGTVNVGTYATQATDVYKGGTFITGEFRPVDGNLFEGTDFTCDRIAPQKSPAAFTAASGHFTITSKDDSFWIDGKDDRYCNIPAGSTAVFTFPCSKVDFVKKWLDRFRYEGNTISSTDFDNHKIWDVEEANGTVTFKLTVISEKAPEISSASVELGNTDDSAVVNVSFTKVGDPVGDVYLVYDTEDKGIKLEAWSENNKISLGKATEAGVVDKLVTGLTTRQVLKMRIFAVNDEGASVSSLFTLYTRRYDVEGVVNEWIGGNGNWTDAAGWSLGHEPADGEIVWIENPDAVVAKSSYKLNNTDHLIAGKLAVSGEISSDIDYVLDGFNFSCTTFVPSTHKLTIKNGSLTAYRTASPGQAKGGVYGDNAKVDILSGGTATMYFYSTGTIFADTFGDKRKRFTFNGLEISEAEFNKRFEYAKVEGVEDVTVSEVTYSAYKLSLKPSEGEPKVESYGASFAEGKITFTLQQAADSIDDTVVTVYYGKVDCGTKVENWSASTPMEKGSDGVNTATVDIDTGVRYYYAIEVKSAKADMTIWRTGNVIAADLPTNSKVWFGKTSDAADTQNWQGGVLPTAQDVVEINDLFAQSAKIDWNSEKIPEVAGWIQSSGVVYFDTTLDRTVAVMGDVTLSGSANWTHVGPAETPVNCLNVKVEGAMTIDTGAIIQAGTAKENVDELHPRGSTKGDGASFKIGEVVNTDGTTVELWTGASYAGDGGHAPYTREFKSYGSILNPLSWGSTGMGAPANNYAGAGLIKLEVNGALTVNGAIRSDGFGWDAEESGSSGGTVNIICASLTGDGEITADGGRCLGGPGSGGRIRVKLTDADATFDEFGAPVKIHAAPGKFTNITGASQTYDVVLGSAGTVTLQTAADDEKSATVIVSDNNETRRTANDTTSLVSATHLPARLNPDENLAQSRWELLNHGKIRLTANAKIAALNITDTAKQKVFLDGHNLKVSSLQVGNQSIRGTFTADELNAKIGGEGVTVFEGEGTVTCGKTGLMVIIR